MEKGSKLGKRLISVFASMILVISFMAMPSSARGIIDLNKNFSISIEYANDGVALSEAEFKLYQVADISEYGEFSVTDTFAGYQISLDYEDNAGWRTLANTLAPYVLRDKIAPSAEGKTDKSGVLKLGGLKAGLYLVTGEPITIGGYKYTAENYLVSVPGLDEHDNWVYSVTSSPKSDREPGPCDKEIERKVIKVWNDCDNKSGKRPEYIEVELLKDGKVYETVRLNEENNWRYTWTGLSDRYTWTVTEKKVPDGYEVSLSRDGITFIITNTKTSVPSPTPKPGNPTPGPGKPNLPQTGMLWWPVPVLVILGVVFVMAGWFISRRSKKSQ